MPNTSRNVPPGRTRCPVTDVPASPTGCPVSPRAAAFDPFGEDYQNDPAATLRWARQDEPVFYSPELGYWVVTRYEDVKAVFRDNTLFSPSVALEKITPTSHEAEEILARHGYAMNRTLVNEDEPAHMPRRRALMEPFTPAALAEHEPMVRRLTREYANRFVDNGEADLVDDMLWEVPLTVALHFLGVPEDDMDTLRRYSIAHTVNTWGRPAPEQQAEVAENVGRFWKYAGQVLERMRKDPSGSGWMPYGIRAQKELPEVVTDSYLHSMMMAGIVAAHETTAHAAANAMRLLLENRHVWEEICADPSLIPNAVEECLRLSGSVAAWRRRATAETTIGGVRVPEGARLLIVQASANHDPARFEDPDGIDIRRADAADHLTFGYGSHQCMGKNLARMELQIFLEEFTRRLPHMELVPGQRFSYVPNTSFRGPEHVHVRWDPALNPELGDPSVLSPTAPVHIGAPSRKDITRAVVIREMHHETDDVVRVRLADASGRDLPRWAPGAHVDLVLGEMSRQYSLCGDPDERGVYEIAVQYRPDGRGGSAFVHTELAVGQTLRMRGPNNHFRLIPGTDHRILVAGGIGITPILAMADLARAERTDYELHYCVPSRDRAVYLDRLSRDHGDRLVLYCSDEGTRLDPAALLAVPRPSTRVHACGPGRLLTALEEACAHWPEDTLHVEHFSSQQAALDPEREHAFEVHLTDSDLTLTVAPDRTLLQALRSANVDVPSDCEEGLCGSCEVSVLSGAVDHRDVVLSAAERRAGEQMMACCSRARDDRLSLRL